MRSLLLACLSALVLSPAALADLGAAQPSDPGAASIDEAEDVRELLTNSAFVFQAPDAELYRALAPFSLRAIAEDGLRFAASAPPGQQPALVTVMERGDQIWAHFQFEADEFLVRLE